MGANVGLKPDALNPNVELKFDPRVALMPNVGLRLGPREALNVGLGLDPNVVLKPDALDTNVGLTLAVAEVGLVAIKLFFAFLVVQHPIYTGIPGFKTLLYHFKYTSL